MSDAPFVLHYARFGGRYHSEHLSLADALKVAAIDSDNGDSYAIRITHGDAVVLDGKALQGEVDRICTERLNARRELRP